MACKNLHDLNMRLQGQFLVQLVIALNIIIDSYCVQKYMCWYPIINSFQDAAKLNIVYNRNLARMLFQTIDHNRCRYVGFLCRYNSRSQVQIAQHDLRSRTD